ncbi:MAG: FAD-binding oxidoreductase, partial [Haemophilus parainfluenzae]|nr:FAD-binding oxidoreductase [Haemophilus parainfluenzae]
MLEFAHQEHVKSYYLDSRNQTFELPPLTQQEEADVCVIGAGFFGLSAALEL